jgi:hypothetical protein
MNTSKPIAKKVSKPKNDRRGLTIEQLIVINTDKESPKWEIQWAIPGVLAYGGRPGYPDPSVPVRIVDQWLDELERQGIRSLINMLSEDEMAVYYRRLEAPLTQYYSLAGLEVRRVSHEEQGVVIAKPILQARLLAAFESLPKPVLIHCSAGGERSMEAVEGICKACRIPTEKRGSIQPQTFGRRSVKAVRKKNRMATGQ